MTSNLVKISGIVVSELNKSYSYGSEDFYSFDINCFRLSGKADRIHITISKLHLTGEVCNIGDYVYIIGTFRSQMYKHCEEGKKEVRYFVFATDICLNEVSDIENQNSVEILGEIVKIGKHRVTSSGRELINVDLKVCRDYAKYDIIPCVIWGRRAIAISRQNKGTVLKCNGRIQEKRRYNNETMNVTYELSCNEIEIIEPIVSKFA